uniref:Uncharacterized protein n=1 Tax=viral metagenome TaxID=1070528 RepID=A0A6M3LY85_9ZZZZ
MRVCPNCKGIIEYCEVCEVWFCNHCDWEVKVLPKIKKRKLNKLIRMIKED